MKPAQFVCSMALSMSLLGATVFAGETSPSPSAPPPPVTAAKQAHVRKSEKNVTPLTAFDLLSIMLSNLGIL